MKENKWIILTILIMGLLAPILPGLGPIISIFAIVILIKYKVISKESSNKHASTNETQRKIKQPQTKKVTPTTSATKSDVKRHLNTKKSKELFGIENINPKVVNSKEAEYFPKIQNDSEIVLNALSCSKGIKHKGKGNIFNGYQSGYYYTPGEESGVLVLTTENIYFLSAKGGISKEFFPLNKVNGVRKIDYNTLELTFGRSKKIYVIPLKENIDKFIEAYLVNNY
ncbi:hypothetical protein AAA448_05975 [Staphylococcus equorum]|uniref:hypothetical protein n=1 Tax=Staphylococcus equorum TaxID=246432 RepID=UPI003D807976